MKSVNDTSQGLVVGAGLVLVALAGLSVRLGLLQAPGEFDEFYHLLAARSWVETGLPQILDGEYWRSSLFTQMVAVVFDVTGGRELPTARLISVFAGTLAPVVLFWWINRVIGIWPAIFAAGFCVLWPQGIIESQMVRFYAAHVLTFLCGAVGLYLLLTEMRAARVTGLVMALLFWALAVHFQISSVIGIAGALFGGGLILAYQRFSSLRQWLYLGIGLALCAVLGLALLSATGLLERAWSFYRWTPAHAAPLRDYVGFYFDRLEAPYGLLWLASVVLAPLAFRVSVPLTLYCGSVFAVCFVTHSFGGMKSLRYLSYAMPFLFVLWALGLKALFDLLNAWGGRRAALSASVIGVAALLALTNFAPRSWTLAQGDGLPARGDWHEARDVIGDWSDIEFVSTTRELHQIAHVGGYDVLFSAKRLTELNPQEDFEIDPRTGRPVAGSVDAMVQVARCTQEGLLVTSPFWWRTEGWEDKLTPLLDEAGVSLETREAGAVLAIRWTNTQPPPETCNALVARLSAGDAGLGTASGS